MAKKSIKSVYGNHTVKELTPNLVVDEYRYIYQDGIVSDREMMKHVVKRKKGWKCIAVHSEVARYQGGHYWMYDQIWERKISKRELKAALKD